MTSIYDDFVNHSVKLRVSRLKTQLEIIPTPNQVMNTEYKENYESLFFNGADQEDLDRYEVNEFERYGV